MRGALGVLLCLLLGCAQNGTSTPVGPCPWPTAFETRADIGEVVDVSLPLEEQVGGRTTVKVESVYDSEPFVFNPPLLGNEVRLEPYEQTLLTQYASPPRAGSFTRTLVLSSEAECIGDKQVVVTVTASDGRYSVSPTSIDFGAVPRGNAAIRTFSLFNDSKGNMRFDLTLQSAEFSLVSGSTYSVTVTPNSKMDIGVRYAPTAAGIHTAALTVKAGVAFEQTVALRGVEGGPKLTVSPSTIDFGELAYSASKSTSLPRSRFVMLSNAGSHPVDNPGGGNALLLQDGDPKELSVEATGSAGAFAVRGFWVDGGTWLGTQLLLGPGESATVRLIANTSAIGLYSNSFQLEGASFIASANSVIQAPCFISTSATVEVPLDGGESDAGIRNTATDRCIVSDMEILQDAPNFELLATTEAIASGEYFPIRVRARPGAPADAGAELRLFISSMNNEELKWPIVVVP